MRIKQYIYILSLLYAATSCRKEEWSEQNQTATLQIEFNWDNLTKGDSIPTGMSLLLYPQNTGKLIRKEISSNKATLNIPSGDYQMIAINNDTKQVASFGLEKYATAGLQLAPLAGRAQEQSLLLSRSIYASNKNELHLQPGVNSLQTVSVQPIACKVKFNIINELGKGLTACSGILTGVASTIMLSTFKTSTTELTNVSFPFEIGTDRTKSEILLFDSSINSEENTGSSSTLLLNTTFVDHSQTTIPIDITEALKSITKGQITINIKMQQNNGMDITGELIDWKTGEDIGVPIKQ